jgi:hypothetical protein
LRIGCINEILQSGILGGGIVRSSAVGVLAAFGAFLGSCAGVPHLDIQSPVTVANIVDRIECEAWIARKNNPILATNQWTGVAELYLQVDDHAGLTPTVSFIRPLATEGTKFAFGASATIKRSRQRIYNQSIRLDMWKLNGATCNKPYDGYDLSGELGITETLNIAFQSINADDIAAFSDKQAIGQTIQFVLTSNVSAVGPTWTLNRFVGPGGLGEAERIDTHKLIISFAPGQPPKEITKADGTKVMRPATAGSADRARQNNLNLLLQSLPSLQNLR